MKTIFIEIKIYNNVKYYKLVNPFNLSRKMSVKLEEKGFVKFGKYFILRITENEYDHYVINRTLIDEYHDEIESFKEIKLPIYRGVNNEINFKRDFRRIPWSKEDLYINSIGDIVKADRLLDYKGIEAIFSIQMYEPKELYREQGDPYLVIETKYKDKINNGIRKVFLGRLIIESFSYNKDIEGDIYYKFNYNKLSFPKSIFHSPEELIFKCNTFTKKVLEFYDKETYKKVKLKKDEKIYSFDEIHVHRVAGGQYEYSLINEFRNNNFYDKEIEDRCKNTIFKLEYIDDTKYKFHKVYKNLNECIEDNPNTPITEIVERINIPYTVMKVNHSIFEEEGNKFPWQKDKIIKNKFVYLKWDYILDNFYDKDINKLKEIVKNNINKEEKLKIAPLYTNPFKNRIFKIDTETKVVIKIYDNVKDASDSEMVSYDDMRRFVLNKNILSGNVLFISEFMISCIGRGIDFNDKELKLNKKIRNKNQYPRFKPLSLSITKYKKHASFNNDMDFIDKYYVKHKYLTKRILNKSYEFTHGYSKLYHKTIGQFILYDYDKFYRKTYSSDFTIPMRNCSIIN